MTWRRLNDDSYGAPSKVLTQLRAASEDLRKFAETAQGRVLVETMRQLRDSGLAERLMGRVRPIARPKSNDTSIGQKRRGGPGRHRNLTPEEKEKSLLNKNSSKPLPPTPKRLRL